jgi:hypothetical protein
MLLVNRSILTIGNASTANGMSIAVTGFADWVDRNIKRLASEGITWKG